MIEKRIPLLIAILPGLFTKVNNSLPEEEKKAGGCFCLFDENPENPGPILVLRVGKPLPDKCEKYFQYCLEKARRLFDHPEHQRSYESRNPEQGQWGGAIRVGGYIFSFSGLPEEQDEELVVKIANYILYI